MRGWAKWVAAAAVAASLDMSGTLPSFAAAESSAAVERLTPDQIDAPQGVIGNWNVDSGRYSATGIFAGSVK
jgi:hypothetical protein